MSVELLYTSAAQGLKQGSRGFCTVVSTAGMPLNLATRLESLSAYRHVFAPGHPDAAQNPVSFSHLRLNVGGRPLSILSRISDYGVDYSQRTNKLAHHVVLEGADLVPAGPAWVMSQPGVMRSQWDGQCSTPGSGPAIPATNQSPRVCMRWSGLFGDAGWGGVVAEVFAQPVGKPLWIIFPLNQSSELLALINESIALLSPTQRWQATFSTYATNLPPDADCKVRCVLAGTEDARLAPARGKVIDLSKPLPPIAPTAITPYVLAARNGTPVPGAIPSVPTAGATSKPRPPVPHSESADELFDVDQSNPSTATQYSQKSQSASELRSARAPSVPPALKNKPSPVDTQRNAVDATSGRKLKLSIIALSVVATLLLATTVFLLVQKKPVEVAKQDASEVKEDNSVTPNEQESDKAVAQIEDAALVPDIQPQPIDAPTDADAAVPLKPPVTQKDKDTSEEQQPSTSGEKPAGADVLQDQANDGTPSKQKVDMNAPPTVPASTSVSGSSSTGNDRDLKQRTIVGQIQAAELLKGAIRVQIEIENFTNEPLDKVYFSHEENGRAYPFQGAPLLAEKRPPSIKVLAYTAIPPNLTVVIDPNDAELKKSATKIQTDWNNVMKAIVDWQNVLRKEGGNRTQASELLIEKPGEPKATAAVSDLYEQILTLVENVDQVIARLEQRESNRAQKSTSEEAKAYFQPYSAKLKNIAELASSIKHELESITEIKREFKTGTIIYLGKINASKLTESKSISRVYRLDEKISKKEIEKEVGSTNDRQDAKPD